MWRKIVKIVMFVVAAALIVAYICYASHLAQEHRWEKRVIGVEVSLPDNNDSRSFVTQEQVYEKIGHSGVKVEGVQVDSLDLANVLGYLSRDGYVKEVDAYVNYSGVLHINIVQHTPVLRLMCGGVNSYVTEEGYVFCQPYKSAYYTSVVTGKYKPHFDTHFEGNVKEYFASLIEQENAKLTKIEADMLQLRKKRLEVYEERDRARSDAEEARLKAKELAKLDADEKQLKAERQNSEIYKKKLQKKSVDFVNLINFVSKVNKDPFWSAEVVQIVADTTYLGEISLRMIPRSGNFEIEFGILDKCDKKLAKLQKFYEKGLPYVGWERYKVVDVRYDKQIICRE